jgi:hypothetical protein
VISKEVKEEPVSKVPEPITPEKEATPEVEIYVHSPRSSKVEEVKVVGMIDLKNINQRTTPCQKIEGRKGQGTQRA